MSTSSPTYAPTSVLITGACGFIGSHVLRFLVKKYPQAQFVNFDLLDYCASLANVSDVESLPNYHFVQGNILSADLLVYVMKQHNIDTVIHFAAQSHVDKSFGNSFAFMDINVTGTHVLLEASKRHGVKRFVHVSTDEVYGEHVSDDQPPFSEDDRMLPTNPYSASKAAAELIVQAYARSFNMPIVITRCNNVYGPNQYIEKVIPKFILRLLRGMPCCIHGDGTNTRNYIYVDDVANAFDVILHNGKIGEIYNIGSNDEVSNRELALCLIEIILNETGAEADKHIEYVENRHFNDKRYKIDSSKLRSLGWKDETSWKEGLERTISWYRSLPPDHWCESQDVSLSAHPPALQNTRFPGSENNNGQNSM